MQGLTPPGSPFQHTQSSMLIRRRSSSSLSSSDDTEIEFKPRDPKRKSDTPKLKKIKKSDKDSNKSESEESASVSSKITQVISKKQHIKATVVEVKLNQYKSFTVKKTGKHVSVDLNYIDEKCYLTNEVSVFWNFWSFLYFYDILFNLFCVLRQILSLI